MQFRRAEHFEGHSGRRSPGKPTAPENGLKSEFADMIAALPDAEPALPRRTPVAAARQAVAQQAATAVYDRSLSQEIVEHLEKHKIASLSQLRIEVHGAVVVVVGEVPTQYEKQLISHFCRQMPGVATFVDGMVVRDRNLQDPKARSSPARRQPRQQYEWQLPFRGWHAGAAAGVFLLAWAVMTFGRGNPDGDRLAVHPVVGKLLVAGQPAAGATIVLHPQDPSIPTEVRPTAQVLADGTFKVTTYEPGDGAPLDDYKLTVEWRRLVDQGQGELLPGPNVIPAVYGKPESTPMRVTVKEGTTNLGPLEIR